MDFDLPPPPVVNLNDMIDGTVKTVDEWIKTEIYRLHNNIKPRHFDNYCQLVEMIQEDITRYQVPPPTTMPPGGYMAYSLYNEDEDEEYMDEDGCDDQDGEDGDEQEEESNDEEEEDTDEEEAIETCINNQEQYITQSNNSIIPNHSNINHKQQHQQTIMNRQPTWLCRAFIEIMRYCSRTKNNQAPKLLLIEFDKLRHDTKLGKRVNVIEFKERLQKILFGKIQMTENLVKVWRLMCDWVTRPYLNSHQHALKWVDVSVNAYIGAQRLFITEVMILRDKNLL